MALLLILSLPFAYAQEIPSTQEDRDRLVRVETKFDEGLRSVNQRLDEGLRSVNRVSMPFRPSSSGVLVSSLVAWDS